MKRIKIKWLSALSVSLLLVACQDADSKEEAKEVEAEETKQAEESPKETSEHSHDHDHDEDAEKIYAGYFDDNQIQDRTLTDWAGDWQSVYPYLIDGTLDEVFAHKAQGNGQKTAEEYKAYYDIGYKTEMERIVIDGDKVTFYQNGEALTGVYKSDGYEILTYDAGNRGVRYIFQLAEAVAGLPQYIQFSDHSISPTDADHYHLYWGDDRKALLEEVVNWPTYYASALDGHTIAHEMMAH